MLRCIASPTAVNDAGRALDESAGDSNNTLPSATHALLHPGRRHRLRGARHGDASGGVDDGDSVAAAGGRGLVKLHAVVAREAGRDERWGGRVEREAGSDSLGLLGRRGFRRVAGEGRALRCAGDGHILLSS